MFLKSQDLPVPQRKFNFLKNRLHFWSSFRFTAQLSGQYREFPCAPPHQHTQPPHYPRLPSQWGISYSRWTYTDSPSLPKSIGDMRVLPWCRTLYGFGQMYNDMYPPLQDHTDYFHCPEKCFVLHLFIPLNPTAGNHSSFYFLHSSAFSRMSYSWNRIICSLFREKFNFNF